MATNYFGSLLGALRTGDAETVGPDPFTPVPSGIKHSRMRVSHAVIDMTDTAPVADDVYRMIPNMKSTDRLWQLWTFSDSAAAATNTLNIGLHLSGDDNDGAVVDEDLFVSLWDIATGEAQTNNLHESGTIPGNKLGLTLWEMAALGAASYTSDPGVLFDITCQVGTGATNGGIQTITAFYSSGA